MALKQAISVDDLRRKNAETQQQRAAEKAGSGASDQQQKGR
ncbi:hypothetical protein AB0L80_31880 [Streptomyces sp. NPDC052069]